jgi:serine/threonine-protein kinase PpkA
MQIDIPGYKIISTLGQGGMATVYLAIQTCFEREVALKVMSPTLSSDPSFGERFLREARIVSRLMHPNIVTVYDVGIHEGLHYLSMEYLAGRDLKHRRF